MNEIEVSVIIITFNQAVFLNKCLDSVLMQKVTFNYEILIFDDCSDDGSRNIILDYKNKYPLKIIPIFPDKNVFSTGAYKILYDFIFPRCRGKYIAFCEGDDYWTSDCKLMKQYRVMQNNPMCSMCVHCVNLIDSEENMLEMEVPNKSIRKIFKNIILSKIFVENWIEELTFFSFNSIFLRIKSIGILEPLLFIRQTNNLDFTIALLAAASGNIYFIDEFMANKRLGNIGSLSFNQKQKSSLQIVTDLKKDIQVLKEYDEYTNGCYHVIITNKVLKNELKILLGKEIEKKNLKTRVKNYLKRNLFKLRGIKILYMQLENTFLTMKLKLLRKYHEKK